MYRPDRIGPWPLITLESGPTSAASLTTAAFSGTPNVEVIGGIPEAKKAGSHIFTADVSIPAGEQGGFGFAISGAQLFDVGEYILSVAGEFLGFSSDEAVAVTPIVGRVSTNDVVFNTLTWWHLVQQISSEHSRASGAEISKMQSSCNTQLIMGDFQPIGSLQSNQLFFGWWLANGGGTVATVEDIHASMSIHRYVEDLRPWDPNR